MNRAPHFKKTFKTRDEKFKELNQERKNQRNQLLHAHRQIVQSPPPPIQPAKTKTPIKKSRLELLKEWKLQKQAKENLNKNIKKPPFHAGRLQTRATGSPLLQEPVQNRVTTRAQAKRNVTIKNPIELNRLNKAKNNVLRPIHKHIFAPPKGIVALTLPMSPRITKSTRKSVKPLLEIGGNYPEPKQINFSYESKVKNVGVTSISQDLTNLKLKSVHPVKEKKLSIKAAEDPLKENKNNDVSPINPIEEEHQSTGVNEKKMEYSPNMSLKPPSNFDHLVFSPLVEKRRGNARKSLTACRVLSIDEEIDHEETERKSRIASFRLFLINETNRLLALAEHWRRMKDDTLNLPEDVQGDIDAVAGKTKLLTSDKFKQFQGLIDKCEGGDPLIKIDDLQGFHDWVSLEIEDLDKTFFALKAGHESNWTSGPCLQTSEKEEKKVKKVMRPIKKTIGASSNMRAHIMAARKKMVNKESPVPDKMIAPSPGRLSCLSTPKAADLRVRALKRCSGIEIINATLKARLSSSPDIQTNKTKPIASDPQGPGTPAPAATPLKSIMRPSTATVPKSDRKVGFGINPIYLQPAEDSPSDDSPDVLKLIDSSTPRQKTRRHKSPKRTSQATPLRRSDRLLSKSPFIK